MRCPKRIYTYTICIVVHPVSSPVSRTSGVFVYSTFWLSNARLDFCQMHHWHYSVMFTGMHLLNAVFYLSGWIVLKRFGTRRKKSQSCGCVLTWQRTVVYQVCGLMYHHLWSETQENGFWCGKLLDLAFLLVSVLNLVKKLEGAKASLRQQIVLKKLPKLAR